MLSITIIGGGIAGLTTAILLAQSGNEVVVLEHKDASYESRSMGGVSISYNGCRIIEAVGLRTNLHTLLTPGTLSYGDTISMAWLIVELNQVDFLVRKPADNDANGIPYRVVGRH